MVAAVGQIGHGQFRSDLALASAGFLGTKLGVEVRNRKRDVVSGNIVSCSSEHVHALVAFTNVRTTLLTSRRFSHASWCGGRGSSAAPSAEWAHDSVDDGAAYVMEHAERQNPVQSCLKVLLGAGWQT